MINYYTHLQDSTRTLAAYGISLNKSTRLAKICYLCLPSYQVNQDVGLYDPNQGDKVVLAIRLSPEMLELPLASLYKSISLPYDIPILETL